MIKQLEDLVKKLEDANSKRSQGVWDYLHTPAGDVLQNESYNLSEDGMLQNEDAEFITLLANNISKIIDILKLDDAFEHQSWRFSSV